MKNIPCLDLHGFTLNGVEDKIDDFLMKHHDKKLVKIMTGKGSGKIQTATKKYLKLGKYDFSFEIINGKKNTGVLLVHL